MLDNYVLLLLGSEAIEKGGFYFSQRVCWTASWLETAGDHFLWRAERMRDGRPVSTALGFCTSWSWGMGKGSSSKVCAILRQVAHRVLNVVGVDLLHMDKVRVIFAFQTSLDDRENMQAHQCACPPVDYPNFSWAKAGSQECNLGLPRGIRNPITCYHHFS